MLARISSTSILFLGIIFLPWWLVGLFLLVALFVFPSYYEALIIGAFFDILYSQGSFVASHSALLFSTVFLIISLFLRDRVMLYARSL